MATEPRIPFSPPNAMVLTFRMHQGKKRPPVVYRATVNRAARYRDQSDVWVSSVAWDIMTGKMRELGIAVGAMESLVRLDDRGRVRCGALLAVEPTPPVAGPYAVGVWQSVWDAPTSGWVLLLTKKGTVERAQWVDDLDPDGDVQIRGWFKEGADFEGREEVVGPIVGWRPVMALCAEGENACKAS